MGGERHAAQFLVEAVEKGVVFRLHDMARVQGFGQNPGQSRLADANRSFDGDESGRLKQLCHGDALFAKYLAKKSRRYHEPIPAASYI